MNVAPSTPVDAPSDKQPKLSAALAPVFVLIALLGINVYLYGADSSYGPNQIALLVAAAAAAVVGLSARLPFKKMLDGIVRSISSAMGAILILLLIGSLAGTWMMSGIVPAMIYYGLEVLNPQIFLVATVIACSVVSVASGSSWSTVATVGIALLAIGKALGVSEAITAGAVISGAYFGDKISPLSDTTNLAAAMAGTELFTHIKYMLWTTVPSILITCGIFMAIGYSSANEVSAADAKGLQEVIADRFYISYWLLLVPVAVLAMVIMKIDAIMALFVGSLLGGLVAVCVQPHIVSSIAGLPDVVVKAETEGGEDLKRPPHYALRAYSAMVNSMALKTEIVSGDEKADLDTRLDAFLTKQKQATDNPELTIDEAMQGEVDPKLKREYFAAKLLQGKGMEGMLNTIWLIITAMCFGGVMEACGLLQRITAPLANLARSTGSLTATTAGSCLFVNTTASDQYLAIIVPGRMFRETYAERGLAPQQLSRTLEDSGTVTSVLIPWNTCGAAQAGVLGVATIAYAPYCFFNLLSPLMTIAFGFVGLGIAKRKPSVSDDSENNEADQMPQEKS